VRQFVEGLLPNAEEGAVADLLAAGDETSLRTVLEGDPGHPEAIVALAALLVGAGDEAGRAEALALLERIPETEETRRIAALARIGADTRDEVTDELDRLLAAVKDDEEARQRYLDLLEVMGNDDPRTAGYRKQLSALLF
jgi:putative thioredoxin